MRLAITLLAAAAAMGIAAATPAKANSTGPNSCTQGAEHFNFFELRCTHDYPWFWTPVRYKDTGGGTVNNSSEVSTEPCYPPPPPHCYTHVITEGNS